MAKVWFDPEAIGDTECFELFDCALNSDTNITSANSDIDSSDVKSKVSSEIFNLRSFSNLEKSISKYFDSKELSI